MKKKNDEKTNVLLIIIILIVLFVFPIISKIKLASSSYYNNLNMKMGDVNKDGVINVADYIIIRRYILELRRLDPDEKILADVNYDNKINVEDYTLIRKYLLGDTSAIKSKPTVVPTVAPTTRPTAVPTVKPTIVPTVKPTVAPTVNSNNYTINYYGNGETGGSVSSHVCTMNGSCAIKANGFTKTGYTFVGWTTNSNGTDDNNKWTGWSGTWTYTNGSWGIANNTLNLYAMWSNNSIPLEIHFIASGYYDDSILIRNSKSVIYIDGGRDANATIKYLKELGITKIDYMIGSHVEYDHVNAQAEILNQFDVGRILYSVDVNTCVRTGKCGKDDVNRLNQSLKQNNKTAETLTIPNKIQVGDMTLYFIAPWNTYSNKNDNSFIFILKYGNKEFMFTGDSYRPFNDADTLLANAKSLGLSDIDVDMLKYPHHGNQRLLDKSLSYMKPEIVITPNYKKADVPFKSDKEVITKYGGTTYCQNDSSTGNIVLTSNGSKIDVFMNASASSYKR